LKQNYWSKADRVFFSTVDLPGIGTPQHAEYVPNPIDTEIFYPKPLQLEHEKLRVLIGSFAWARKGTDTIIKALSELKSRVEATIIEYGDDYAQMISLADSLKLRLRSLPTTTHEKMCEYFWQHDLVMDQFMVGVVGNIFFEAVACGRPALGYLSSKYKEYERLPFRDVDSSEKIVKVIESFETEKDLYNMWRSQYAYVSEIHNATNVAERIFNVYKELRPNA
jgi:glycosyltransferase involved in cell wall biosynthesis